MTATATRVSAKPSCDMRDGQEAYADARLPISGRWSNVCKTHFDEYGCELGIGKGQEFVLNSASVNLTDGVCPSCISAVQEDMDMEDSQAAEMCKSDGDLLADHLCDTYFEAEDKAPRCACAAHLSE